MEAENNQWQAPLPPGDFKPAGEPPKMSLLQTLTGIFFEPAETFEDLRRKPIPRIVLPAILIALLVTSYGVALQLKLGKERIVKEQLNMKIMEQVPEEAKKEIIAKSKEPFKAMDFIGNIIGFVIFFIILAILALIYWGGGLAFGGEGNFLHGLAISVYSMFPVVLVSTVASFVILFFKSADDINMAQSQSGLLKLNPTLLFSSTPVVNALLGRLDLLVLWGMFLGAVGLQKCLRTSSGSSWFLSIIIWLIGTAMAVLTALMFGGS